MGKFRRFILMLLPLCALVCAEAVLSHVDGWMSDRLFANARVMAHRDHPLSGANRTLASVSGSLHRQLAAFVRQESRVRPGHDAVLHAVVATDGTVGSWTVEAPQSDLADLITTSTDDDASASSCREKA